MTNIVIVGDTLIDEWVIVERGENAPEPNIPRYQIKDKFYLPGGAGNVARQLQQHNCNTHLLSVFGRDTVQATIIQTDMLCSWINKAVNPVKTRYWDGEKIVARFDEEKENYGLNNKELEQVRSEILQTVERLIKEGKIDVLVLSEYGKGLFDPYFGMKLIRLTNEAGTPSIVDAKYLEPACFTGYKNKKGVSIFKCNDAYLMRYAAYYLGSSNLVVTCSKRPVYGEMTSKNFILNQVNSPLAINVVGAGDCFTAHLALAWAKGVHSVDAVRYADFASRSYVQRPFCEPVLPCEADNNRRIVNEYEAEQIVKYRCKGKKIVASSGCFDNLHPGHIHTLQWAKSKGDVLFVLVNDDDGVRQLKGENRPVMELHHRCKMLEALSCVDYVIPFAGSDPLPTLRKIAPEAIIKGPEWAGIEDQIPEFDEMEVWIAPPSPFPKHSTDLICKMNLTNVPKMKIMSYTKEDEDR